MEITGTIIDKYRNTGGFDIIGSGRTKLESEQQFEKSLAVCKKHNIDGIVIIGGDDSNTNGAVLAGMVQTQKLRNKHRRCPKTIGRRFKK